MARDQHTGVHLSFPNAGLRAILSCRTNDEKLSPSSGVVAPFRVPRRTPQAAPFLPRPAPINPAARENNSRLTTPLLVRCNARAVFFPWPCRFSFRPRRQNRYHRAGAVLQKADPLLARGRTQGCRWRRRQGLGANGAHARGRRTAT